MLLFSGRPNVPKIYYVLELLLIFGFVAIVAGTGTAVARLWMDALWSLRWLSDCVFSVAAVVIAAWMYRGDLDRSAELRLGVMAAWLLGAVVGLMVHFAPVWWAMWQAARAV
jgi:hypothetical protein